MYSTRFPYLREQRMMALLQHNLEEHLETDGELQEAAADCLWSRLRRENVFALPR